MVDGILQWIKHKNPFLIYLNKILYYDNSDINFFFYLKIERNILSYLWQRNTRENSMLPEMILNL